MVIAVPGGSNIACGPVRKQARCNLVLFHTTGQKVLVVIPDSFQILVLELYRGLGPEIAPLLLAQLAPFSETNTEQAIHFLTDESWSISLLGSVYMRLGNGDCGVTSSRRICLLLQSSQQHITRC